MLVISLPTNVNAATLNGGSVKKNAVTISKLATTYSTKFTKSQKRKWYKFKTKNYHAGYRVTVKNVSLEEMWITLYDSSGNEIDYNSYWKGKSFDVMHKLKKNKWYYLEIENTCSTAGTVSFSVSVRKDAIRDCKANAKALLRNQTFRSSLEGEGDYDYFKFKPSATGYYTFDFFNIGGYSKDILITDSKNNDLDYDFFVRANKHFKSKRKLIKGRWYYIKISPCSADGGYYSVTIR